MERRDDSLRLRERAHVILFALAVSILTQAVWAPAHAVSTSIPPANQPVEGPQATVESLVRAYRELDADAVKSLLTTDYRFHSMGDSLAQLTFGADGELEARVLRNMKNGIIRNGDTLRGPADSVGMVADGFREVTDPEHPDSTDHYRVVVVGRWEFGIRNGAVRMTTRSRETVFQLVRGDAAILSPGQVAGADRWYIRRWIEDVAGIREQLEREKGVCGEPPSPAVGPASRTGTPVTALVIRPLLNPACAKLEVTCELPGGEPARVEVYDVAGRLVNRRPVPLSSGGPVTVEAGHGANIVPGVYWVRLSQAARKPSTRMVVVAR